MKDSLQNTLGLTLNEARIYEALIKGVVPEIAELKTETELPRTRIYEVLSSLAAKNLVEKKSSGYRLIPPQESIPLLIDTLDRDHQRRRSAISEFGDYLSKVWKDATVADIPPGVEIFQLEDGEAIFNNHLEKAKKRVWIAAGAAKASIDMRKLGTTLASVYHGDMDVKYLFANEFLGQRIKSGFNHFTPFKNMAIQLRFNPELHSSYVFVDNILYIFFFGGNHTVKATSLITTSKELVDSFQWMFEHLWESGSQIEESSSN